MLLSNELLETLPWIGTHDPADAGRLQDEQHSRMQRIQNFQLGCPEKLIEADDPRRAPQENGGLADFWYLDGGDILCYPLLVLPCLQACDAAHVYTGVERNQQKTEVTYNVADLDAAPPGWKINHGNFTLGIAVGPRRCLTDQLLAEADIIWALHERLQVCHDPQTQCALFRESLGVSRINHILRVHGHTILKTSDEVGQRSLERLFPGFIEDSSEQAAISARQSGIGYKRSVDVASSQHTWEPFWQPNRAFST